MDKRRIHVSAKKWTYDKDFVFPEDDHIDDARKEYGIAFSGGGNRSASLTIGYLRALHKLKLIDKVKYLSCVSGGSWASIPYTYLDESISDDVFLGADVKPEQLTYDLVKQDVKRSFTGTIADTRLLGDLLTSPFAGDERFAKILSQLYLNPYLIGDRSKFFSLNEDVIQEIIDRKGNEELRSSDFYKVNKKRPYLISGGILTHSLLGNINRFPFEMTPLYVGIPSYFKGKGSNSSYDIGGGYVEPFGFDTDSPEAIDDEGIVRVRIKRRANIFSIADVMATTGAALAEHLDRFLINIGFPEFKYWSPKNPDKAKEYDFADGGLLDNSGIMPLIRRKVKRIIVFVNGTSDLVNCEGKENEEVSSMIKALFTQVNNHWGEKDFKGNIVLKQTDKTGAESYQELRQQLVDLNKRNEPAVVQQKYITVKNSLFAIPAGQEVEVMWVHNAFVKDWCDKITDPDLKGYVQQQHADKNFPNYSTFFTNGTRMIDLDVAQANIMAHHAHYVIDSLATKFKSFFT